MFGKIAGALGKVGKGMTGMGGGSNAAAASQGAAQPQAPGMMGMGQRMLANKKAQRKGRSMRGRRR